MPDINDLKRSEEGKTQAEREAELIIIQTRNRHLVEEVEEAQRPIVPYVPRDDDEEEDR